MDEREWTLASLAGVPAGPYPGAPAPPLRVAIARLLLHVAPGAPEAIEAAAVGALEKDDATLDALADALADALDEADPNTTRTGDTT